MSQIYEEVRVTWTGVILSKELAGRFMRIEFQLPAVKAKVRNGRWTLINSKRLSIDKPAHSSWEQGPIGATVRLSTKITKGFVTAVMWSDVGGKKAWFTILADGGTVEEIISSDGFANTDRKP